MAKNPIGPCESTPEGIRQFQEVEPHPNWQNVFDQNMPSRVELMRAWVAQSDALDLDTYKNNAKALAKRRADAAVKRGTLLSWAETRLLVYIRDNGTCDVCGLKVDWEYYECGHIVDRVCGGSDRLENLVVMCNLCNRIVKKLHETKEQYLEWKRSDPTRRLFNGS